ncbi:hypothetical protein V866_007250 [Kwoniella sp. B9012]
MSFTIRLGPKVDREGRSQLLTNLRFTLHPLSTFQSESQDSQDGTVLDIVKYFYSGYLWDFWLADHSNYGKVVFKLLYVPGYPCSDPNFWEYVPRDQLANEALKEEQFYLGLLKDLQGQLIPWYYGCYQTEDGNHLGVLLEYAGIGMGSGLVTYHAEWREKLYEAYETLHLRGVHHGHVYPRHILTDSRNRIRLVALRRSSRADLTKENDVEALMLEALDLRRRIGLEREEEVKMSLLPSSYYSRLNDSDRKHLMDSFPLRSDGSSSDIVDPYKEMLAKLFPPTASEPNKSLYENIHPSHWISSSESTVIQGDEVAKSSQAEE